VGTPNSIGDAVLVQSTTTGTGTYQLGPPLDGHFSLKDGGVPNGARVSYVVVDSLTTPTLREVVEGIYTEGTPGSLSRVSVKRSSTGAAINWPPGTRYIFLAPNVGNLPLLDTEGLLPLAYTRAGLTTLLTRATPIAIGNNTPAGLPWDNSVVDQLGMLTATPVTTLVLAEGGTYHIEAQAVFAANASGNRILQLAVGGDVWSMDQQQATGTQTFLRASVDLPGLGPGAAIQANVSQSSGGNLNIEAGPTTHISIRRVR